MKRKELTKSYLEKLGITNVTPDGRIFKNGVEVKQHIHNSKSKRKYFCVSLHDPEIYAATPKEMRNSGSGLVTLLTHVINYVWNKENCPAGLVVDHIDNNPQNNDISNLQLITQRENIIKDNPNYGTSQLKCDLTKPLSFYEAKLQMHLEKYEQAKKIKDKRQIKSSVNNVSYTRARIRYWKAHNIKGETKHG